MVRPSGLSNIENMTTPIEDGPPASLTSDTEELKAAQEAEARVEALFDKVEASESEPASMEEIFGKD